MMSQRDDVQRCQKSQGDRHFNNVNRNGWTSVYTYDARYRLTKMESTLGAEVTTTHRTYDGVGNLLSVWSDGANPVSAVTYTYDELNRVSTEASPLLCRYRYDLAGNRVVAELPYNHVIVSLFDALNRCTSMREISPTYSVSTNSNYLSWPVDRSCGCRNRKGSGDDS